MAEESSPSVICKIAPTRLCGCPQTIHLFHPASVSTSLQCFPPPRRLKTGESDSQTQSPVAILTHAVFNLLAVSVAGPRRSLCHSAYEAAVAEASGFHLAAVSEPVLAAQTQRHASTRNGGSQCIFVKPRTLSRAAIGLAVSWPLYSSTNMRLSVWLSMPFLWKVFTSELKLGIKSARVRSMRWSLQILAL